MGVWRDSVRSQYNEETGARTAMQRGTIETIVARATRDSFAVLTPRRLMGVNPRVPGSSPGRGANTVSRLRWIPAFLSTATVDKKRSKTPLVSLLGPSALR